MRLRIHSALVHFPVACWSLGTGCDVLSLLRIQGAWGGGSLLILIGLVAGLGAAVAGALELMRLPERLMRAAGVHATIMVCAWSLYLVGFILRVPQGALTLAPQSTSIIICAAGFLTMAVGGYLGGRLVYHVGAWITPKAPD
jgi:uncharacterized membrane protein